MKTEELELKKLQHKRYLSTGKNWLYLAIIVFIPIATDQITDLFGLAMMGIVVFALLFGAFNRSKKAEKVEKEITKELEEEKNENS